MATTRKRPATRTPRARRAAMAAAPVAPALRLAEVQGHASPVAFLRRAWEHDHLAHAYVFTGPVGIGKFATARALAAGLHCDVAPFEGCGACAGCRSAASGAHPDIRTLSGPVKDRRDISVDQVRELQRALGFRSISPHPKVGIVNDADRLTIHAQNALLKTLEEPSGDTVLILIAANATSLVPTILSRCQRIAFRPLDTNTVATILERHGLARAEVTILAAYAEGSPGRALALDREFLVRHRPAILERLTALRPGQFKPLVDLAQELAGGGSDPVAVLEMILSWYRDALCQHALGGNATLRNPDLAARLPVDDIAESLRKLEATYATLLALRQNANRNLAFTDLLMRLTG